MFLPRLYRHNRPLFWTCCFFIAASLAVIPFRHPVMPFGTWAMYSVPQPAEGQSHTFFVLEVDGNARFLSPAFSHPHRYFFNYSAPRWYAAATGTEERPRFATLRTLCRQMGLRSDAFFHRAVPDSAAVAAYGPWLRRAVERRTGRRGQRIELVRVGLEYATPGVPVLRSCGVVLKP